MAVRDTEIFNPRTGQRMRFVRTANDTGGEVLELECVSPPTSQREPEHFHPHQANVFEVHRGALHIRMGGAERVVGAGERAVVPAGVPHFFWVEGDQEAHYRQEFRPAMKSEAFFETYFGLARDGKLDARGMPGLLMLAVMVMAFWDEIRVVSPPPWLQRILFTILAPIGRAAGYGVAN